MLYYFVNINIHISSTSSYISITNIKRNVDPYQPNHHCYDLNNDSIRFEISSIISLLNVVALGVSINSNHLMMHFINIELLTLLIFTPSSCCN
jgi:hypothetical protein